MKWAAGEGESGALLQEKRPPVIGSEEEEGSFGDEHEAAAAGGRFLMSEKTPPPALPPKPKIAPQRGKQQAHGEEPLPPPETPLEEAERKKDGTPSETCEGGRGFEPEGSVDMSPTYSESVSVSTPPYVKWAESIHYLLDDQEGFQLFRQYLQQQSLEHLLMFYVTCKGFKNQVQQNALETDPDRQAQLRGDECRLVGVINKRYINPSRKNVATRVDLIEEESRKEIELKIQAAKGQEDLELRLDSNIFDQVQQSVLDHLDAKCYPNFLKSDIYVDCVQQAADDAGSSSRCGTQSSAASSVSIRLSRSAPDHRAATADDSGISGVTEPSRGRLPDVQDASSVILLANSAAASTSLPTVDEEKELKILLNKNNSSSSNRSKNNRLDPSFKAKRSSGVMEAHPAPPPITSASFAYHAYSSNWNPVSRQDSEIQSQSSGVLGDTDTEQQQQQKIMTRQWDGGSRRKQKVVERRRMEESSQRNRDVSSHIIPRPRHQAGPAPAALVNTPQGPAERAEFARLLAAKLQVVVDSDKNAVLERDKQKRLAEKLNQIDADSSVASFPASATAQNFIMNRSSAQNVADAESDQSILDDHVNRVFVETPPSTRSPPGRGSKTLLQGFDSMHIHPGGPSGHRTLPGRSTRQHSGSSNAFANSSLQSSHHFGGSHMVSAGYRSVNTSGFSSSNVAGDLAYFPNQKQQQHGRGMHRGHQGTVNRSYSDVDYGAANRGAFHNQSVGPQSRQPVLYSSQTKDRVHDWVQNVSQQFGYEDKGRRVRSQDRSDPQMRFGGSMNTSHFGGSMNQQYYGAVQPNLLQAKLLEHQQSRMGPARTPVATKNSINVCLPVGAPPPPPPPQTGGDNSVEFTTAVYKFPQEKEDMPYRIKIPGRAVTLRHVMEYMPKKGVFRYYFKTKVDGEVCFEEETNEGLEVPMWENKIIVQCRND